MGRKAAGPAERVIKRYDNRKLYDAEARRYVTLEDLAGMVARGDEVRVVDQKTGEDLTTTVLAQVILEGVKERRASIPRQVLARLIRLGSAPSATLPDWSGPQEVAARAREEAERIVSGLMQRGRLTLEEALALRQEIAQSVHGLVSEAQRGLEGRLHKLLERTESEAGASGSLQALKARLMAFETYLVEPKAGPRKGRAVARPRRRGRSPVES